jgi:hypothetical protein
MQGAPGAFCAKVGAGFPVRAMLNLFDLVSECENGDRFPSRRFVFPKEYVVPKIFGDS